MVTPQILGRLVSRANETDLRVSISTPAAKELLPFPKALLLQLCLGFNACWALYKLRARHNKMWEKKCLKLQLLPPDLFNEGAELWGHKIAFPTMVRYTKGLGSFSVLASTAH